MPELKDLEKIIVVTGHFGAGKTNFAVNLAKEAKKTGRPVTLIDLDIVNPYFRAADDKGELEELGIRCIIPDFANTNVDIPTLPPEIYSALEAYENPDYDGVTIFDVGGDNGAAALGMYEKWFREYPYSMLYCCSLYRPLTEEPEDAVGCMREIEYYSRLRTQGTSVRRRPPVSSASRSRGRRGYPNYPGCRSSRLSRTSGSRRSSRTFRGFSR